MRYLMTMKYVILFIPILLMAEGCKNRQNADPPYFRTRGIVLSVEDLSTVDWPKRAKESGLTTIATHVTPHQVAEFIRSSKGQSFLQQCRELGLEVEHELHAMNDLLPRELFEEDSTMFRMNKEGRRIADFNLCVHSQKALETAGKNAVKYAKILTPTTGRYFYWIDDGRPMCYCPQCSEYSDSEQALILENHLLKALKAFDPKATLAHLAYINTLEPPAKVKPEPGIFLEFAPIQRSWEEPLGSLETKVQRQTTLPVTTHGQLLELLDKNLAVFGKDNAQVLEYWLDVSLFSGWKKPAKELPWNEAVFLNDIDLYAQRGIKHITTFAVYIDDVYLNTYPDAGFIKDYGRGLKSYGVRD